MHTILAVYASPKKHKQFANMVRKMEYPYQGKFKGKTRPTLSEVRLYDVRIKKEVAPLFVRDVNAMFATPKATVTKDSVMFKNMKAARSTFTWADRVFHWLRKFTPLRGVEKAPGPADPKYKLAGWEYVMFVGALDDPHTPDDEEAL